MFTRLVVRGGGNREKNPNRRLFIPFSFPSSPSASLPLIPQSLSLTCTICCRYLRFSFYSFQSISIQLTFPPLTMKLNILALSALLALAAAETTTTTTAAETTTTLTAEAQCAKSCMRRTTTNSPFPPPLLTPLTCRYR